MTDVLHKGTILIYGGSFDPPHLGHLNVALKVQDHFHFDRFIFLPCKSPVLKNPSIASEKHRYEMLKILLSKYSQFSISTCELDRDTPSYMVDTLEKFRNELGSQVSITLLLGQDAFFQLNRWHDWYKLPKLCNLLVIYRSGILLEQNISEKILSMFVDCRQLPFDILNSPCGKLTYFNAGSYPVSSTDIRHTIQSEGCVDFGLSKEIVDYIQRYNLYDIT